MTPLTARGQYRFEVLNTDTGLPQSSVYSILQSRDGYLWFTTLDGLVRYDGARCFVFNKANADGIKSNRFTRLVEDAAGALWICTEDGGLTRYTDGAFTTYTTADGLPHNWIFNLREAAAGELLIQTYAGLARWRDGQISVVSTDFDSFDSILGYVGRSGALWQRFGTRLRCLRDGVMSEYRVPEYSPDDQHYPQLYEDRAGRLWIGANQPGLLVLEGGVLRQYGERDGLPSARVTAFCEDREGTLWLGTDGGGLVRFQGGKFTVFTSEQGLPSKVIGAIYEDREGTLWAGTPDSGVVRISRQMIKTYAEADGLPGRSFYPVLEDREGNIWMGGEGLYRLSGGTFTYYPLAISSAARRSRAPFKQVTALYEDVDGTLWIGSHHDLFAFKDGKFTVESERLGAPFVETAIYVMRRDRQGVLWFGTQDGLVRYADGERRRYTTADGLPSNEVHALCEDRAGNLWVGTYGGLAHLVGDRFTVYKESDGLASHRVRALYEDGDGALWIGTYDGGLNRFAAGRFTRFDMSDGLASNGVFAILEDGDGNFWMSSNQGIYRVHKAQLNDFAEGRRATIGCVAYGKADGMRTPECNGGQQPAGVRGRDGRLWFPTLAGVVVIDPRAVSVNRQPPPVVIEQLLLDRQPVRLAEALRIYPGQENLEIHYAGLSFIKPDHVRFRYRMEGLDREWIEAAERRVAFYSHLPAGEYLFKVIAANSDGVWNDTGAGFRIIVIAPFWQQPWFVALLALAAGATIWLAYRARIRQLQSARRAQEAFARQLIASQEQERQRIAAGLHDSLGQNLLVIKNWTAMAKRLVEPQSRIREPLEEIAAAVSQSLEEVREIAYNLRPYHLDEIGLTAAIHSMIDRVADASAVQFQVMIEALDGLLDGEAEINLYRIIQESINNIIKHAEASEAAIVIGVGAEALTLIISDNGRGFVPEEIRQTPSHGFGLTGIAERARLLGGRESIQSAPGKGTRITITLALEKRQARQERKAQEGQQRR